MAKLINVANSYSDQRAGCFFIFHRPFVCGQVRISYISSSRFKSSLAHTIYRVSFSFHTITECSEGKFSLPTYHFELRVYLCSYTTLLNLVKCIAEKAVARGCDVIIGGFAYYRFFESL